MRSPNTSRTPWVVAAVCTYGTMWVYLTYITLPFAVGLFLKPESAEFGWGRATISGGVLFANIIGGLLGPLAGRWIDRWGSRAVSIPGGILFGLATAGMATVNGSILQLYILFGLVGAFHSFSGTLAFMKLTSAWFTKRRGMALAMTSGIGTGIGAGISPWFIGYFIDHYGWREAYIALGLMIIVLEVPSFFLLREPAKAQPAELPETPAELPLAVTTPITLGHSASEAFRTRNFWVLMIIIVFSGVATGGSLVHLLPFLQERGVSLDEAKGLLSLLALVTTAGRLITGHFLDRFQTPRTAIFVYFSLLIGLILLDLGPVSIIFTAVIIMGIGVGAEGGGITSYFVARYFGLKAFGEIYGYISAATIVSLGVGPVMAGLLFDLTGSYGLSLKIMDVALVIAIAAVMFLGPYVYDVKPAKRR